MQSYAISRHKIMWFFSKLTCPRHLAALNQEIKYQRKLSGKLAMAHQILTEL
jgi:hypothetical protein